jgi:hypothetical protein
MFHVPAAVEAFGSAAASSAASDSVDVALGYGTPTMGQASSFAGD